MGGGGGLEKKAAPMPPNGRGWEEIRGIDFFRHARNHPGA
jgi:hypothetical protein